MPLALAIHVSIRQMPRQKLKQWFISVFALEKKCGGKFLKHYKRKVFLKWYCDFLQKFCFSCLCLWTMVSNPSDFLWSTAFLIRKLHPCQLKNQNHFFNTHFTSSFRRMNKKRSQKVSPDIKHQHNSLLLRRRMSSFSKMTVKKKRNKLRAIKLPNWLKRWRR